MNRSKTVRTMGHKRLAALIALLVMVPPSHALRLNSYAIVNEDGSLNVRSYTLRLFGIAIPPTVRTCRTFERPPVCGPQTSLALDFKIDSNFVDCETVGENPDGTLAAICRVNGEDLAAWMLAQGWAYALPGAPAEYAALEDIARQRGVGLWGWPAAGAPPWPPWPPR
jgi:endonuclease YncB( thermonuclease family)